MNLDKWRNSQILWVAALPLFAWKGNFEGTKVVYFFSGLMLLIPFLLIFERKKLSKSIFRSDLWYWGWLAILLIASFYGVHPFDSILGGSYRHQGVIFFVGLWVAGKSVLILPTKFRKRLIYLVACVVLVEAVIVLVQKVSGEALINGRAMGTLGEPNAAAGFLAMGGYFAVKLFNKSRWLVYTLLFVAILATGSRTGLLAFLAIIVLEKIEQVWWKYLVILVSVVAILLLFSMNRATSPFENRLVYWEFAGQMISERPILGYGAESGEVVYELAYKKAEIPLYKLIIDRSHNLFLDVAMWSGILGFISFSGWVSGIYKNSKGKRAIIAWLMFASLQPLGVTHWMLLMLFANDF